MVGRDEEKSRLFVSVDKKGAMIGTAGSVPPCVSRNQPKIGTAHCMLTYTKEYGWVITNLKTGVNHTYVNGVDVEKAPVKDSDTIELGAYKFRLNLKQVVDTAKKILPAPTPPPVAVDIRHLEGIWNHYQNELIEIQKRQKRIGMLQTLPLAIGSIGSIISFAAGATRIGIIVTGISLCVILYTLSLRRKDNSIEERQALNTQMELTYVCPHCRRFLGMKSYTVVTQDKQCLRCNAKFLFDAAPQPPAMR